MSKLRKAAKGRPCQIRLPGVCLHDRETVVGCHYRLPGLSGLGIKSDDIFIAHGCFRCHQYVDTHKDAKTQLAFAEAVFRTQAILRKEGLI